MDNFLHEQWEQVTKMLAEYNRLNDCSSRRYSHPEIRRYFTDGSKLTDGETLYEKTYGLVHDNDYPEEMRKKILERINIDYPHPLDPTHTDSLPEHGEWQCSFIPGCEKESDAPLLNLLIRSPKERTSSNLPVLYYIGGGGFFTTYCDMNEIESLCKDLNCIVVIPLYRIGQGHPYPEAINDLQAGFDWIYNNSDEIGANPDNITIFGLSTGGGLGISLSFRLKNYGYRPRGIVASFPPLDDRLIYESSRIFSGQFDGYFFSTMYRLYLGKNYASPFLGPEAAANRASIEECKGFPPTFIHTAELDIGRDPCLEFSHKVASAGSFTELHNWGGSDHMGLLFSKNSPYSERFNALIKANILDCMTYDLRRNFR